MNNDAFAACLIRALGLTASDLTEIGGWSGPRMAQHIMSGTRPCPADVLEALEDIQDDLETITDELVARVEAGEAAIYVYRDLDQLRQDWPHWPGRGKAAGGFLGPFQIAAHTAAAMMDENGIEVELLFCA
ncbi:hypothetical protein [Paracoccus sp. (in: a-proteobacteria)]|uniref:hypothetical protein n=1 Tax=Paracoccus sp. TaxID=267 RepID=UPI0026DEA26F|nr:hypothetical protein [Paracoccus sp. (in: a-proteobacteria)]MDO5648925.1 hypothetical protein [Paracoccus sp. (in: a-proteobacteria)]